PDITFRGEKNRFHRPKEEISFDRPRKKFNEIPSVLTLLEGGRGGLMVRPWGRGFQARNPIPLKIRRVWGLLNAKSYVVVKRPPAGVAWKFGEGVPAQASSSSSGRGSKLRDPSQNSPRVASKMGR
ncbi:hypothetical protein AVEN_151852-1, partial [Araneus ventricosus]